MLAIRTNKRNKNIRGKLKEFKVKSINLAFYVKKQNILEFSKILSRYLI